MKKRPLGRTGISVSEICLGTMTWGSQNTEAEAHEQMDYAAGEGINFFDTAEMYPTTPMRKETIGGTEKIIGSWFAARKKRDDIILATKITGEGSSFVRKGAAINGKFLREALEGSLKRLRTDYVDVYQIHWPNRGSYHFRRSWKYDPTSQDSSVARAEIAEIVETAGELVKEGKMRFLGLSNESAWGTAEYIKVAEQKNLPRIVSIQNEYNLLQRIFDLDLAELCHHENVGLMAWSPLAAGMLSGKYLDGKTPPGSRKSINETLGGRWSEYSTPVMEKYVATARKHGLDPAQMAIAWCLTRPSLMSVIIGATSMDQLKSNIAAAKLELSKEVMADIAAIHRLHPMPM